MNKPDPNHEIVVRLMRQLHGYAQDLGLEEFDLRVIVERVIADMPLMPDDDRMARARNWLLIASA